MKSNQISHITQEHTATHSQSCRLRLDSVCDTLPPIIKTLQPHMTLNCQGRINQSHFSDNQTKLTGWLKDCSGQLEQLVNMCTQACSGIRQKEQSFCAGNMFGLLLNTSESWINNTHFNLTGEAVKRRYHELDRMERIIYNNYYHTSLVSDIESAVLNCIHVQVLSIGDQDAT